MSEKIKVLIVTHSLPFYHIHSWQLLGSHNDIDLTVAYGKGFFTGKKDGVPEGRIPDVCNFKNHSCNIVKSFLGLKFLWNSAAINLIKKNKYDVIIHQAELKMLSVFYLLRVAKKKKIKFALWGIGAGLKKSLIIDGIKKYLSRKIDAYIFYSEANKKRYINWGMDERELFVAKNSINLEEIFNFVKSYPQKLNSVFKKENNIDSFNILTVGRMIERKKVDWLIYALQELNKQFDNIKLIVIGNGPKLEEYMELAKKLNLEKNIVFTNKLTGIEQIGPYFMASDIVVAPAQVGHLATESHAYGKPIILSNNKACQGPESLILIPEVTGLEYEHGDIMELTNKIKKLYIDADFKKKLTLKSQRRAKEFTGTHLMVNGFLNAIERMQNVELNKFEVKL